MLEIPMSIEESTEEEDKGRAPIAGGNCLVHGEEGLRQAAKRITECLNQRFLECWRVDFEQLA